jgi:phosphatidylserine/phosphatidylglycerophosphate/cardiolipin synthase-like enzyme
MNAADVTHSDPGISPRSTAALDRLSAEQRRLHPDKSGVRLVADGMDAFALRALSARSAARTLDLQYYLWHDDRTGRCLAQEVLLAADRGVRVRILELYELKPAPEGYGKDDGNPAERMRLGSSKASLHTKAAIVDGERVFVGSFNLDPRSAMLNCEMGVWIRDLGLTRQLAALFGFGATPQRSFIVSLDERGQLQWTESVNGSTVHHRRDPMRVGAGAQSHGCCGICR